MIASKQYQPQLPIFYAKPAISNNKFQSTNSVLGYSGFRERQKYKKVIAKRSSCHNISVDNRENESQQFSNKLLDHIFNQIKHNHKTSLKQKNQGSIIHAISQKSNQRSTNQLNQQNNLKIKSINNLIKPKSDNTCRNKLSNIPFQNKKLMTLRKGKSYTLYTQEIEPQITEPSNEGKILPWELQNNPIIDLPGAAQEIDDQTVEQHYLKSHNLKPKESKSFAKYNTLAFSPPEQRRPHFQKYSSIDVTRSEKPKAHPTNYNQIFSTHSVKEPSCKLMHHRGKHENIKRTLTEMRMDIQQIQLEKPDQNPKNIKIQDFFQCIIPKNIFPRKPSINPPHRPAHAFRRDSNESIMNCFLIGRKI